MGMGMMGGGMGMQDPSMSWLGGLHQTFGSLGQMSELLGMNADAMQYAFGSFAHFLERIGGATHEIVNFFMGVPPQMMVDPRTGQMVPMIDPRTGQPIPALSPEQFRKERKQKLKRWLVGLVVVYLLYRMVRASFTTALNSFSSANSNNMNNYGGPPLGAPSPVFDQQSLDMYYPQLNQPQASTSLFSPSTLFEQAFSNSRKIVP